MNNHLIWATSLFLIVLTICGTLIYLNHNAWTIRFEMDSNTKEAIESIEYPIVEIQENCTISNCNRECCFGNVCTTTFMDSNWCNYLDNVSLVGINFSNVEQFKNINLYLMYNDVNVVKHKVEAQK